MLMLQLVLVSTTTVTIPGSCGPTPTSSDCWLGVEGSFAKTTTMASCLRRCAGCARCRYVSFSKQRQDCSWYSQCLGTKNNSASPWWQRRASSYTTVQVSTKPVDSIASLLDLAPEDLQGRARGLPSLQDAALRSFAHRLATHSEQPGRAPLRIAIYGTSITAGVLLGRYGANFSFSHLLEARLQRRYGSAAVTVSIFGYNAATLQYMHHCVDSLLSEPADLYIVEYHEGQVGLGLTLTLQQCRRGDLTRTSARTRARARNPDQVGGAQSWRSINNLGARSTGNLGAHLIPLVARLRARPGCPAVLLMSALDQIMCVRAIKRMGPCHRVPLEVAENARLAEGCLEGWESEGRCKAEGCDSAADCAAAAQPRPARRPSVSGAALLSPMQRIAEQVGVGHVALREAMRPKLKEAGVFRKVVDSLVVDFLHFTRPGHELMAEMLEHRIVSAVPTVQVGAERLDDRHCHSPSVDGTNEHTEGGAVCAFGQRMQPLVRQAIGWEWKVDYAKVSE